MIGDDVDMQSSVARKNTYLQLVYEVSLFYKNEDNYCTFLKDWIILKLEEPPTYLSESICPHSNFRILAFM